MTTSEPKTLTTAAELLAKGYVSVPGVSFETLTVDIDALLAADDTDTAADIAWKTMLYMMRDPSDRTTCIDGIGEDLDTLTLFRVDGLDGPIDRNILPATVDLLDGIEGAVVETIDLSEASSYVDQADRIRKAALARFSDPKFRMISKAHGRNMEIHIG